jgi:hypothetical protein
VTYDRKTSNIYTGISISVKQWDVENNLINKNFPGYASLLLAINIVILANKT